MRLGMFDGGSAQQPFARLGPSDVCTPAHQALALDAARQSVVLLKNRRGRHRAALPLSPAVAMVGNYAGKACRFVTPLQGVGKYAKAAVAHQGVEAARQTDATIVVAGLDQKVEAEGLDRTSLLLPWPRRPRGP
jgi:xylan 1,4-beta-xylosidase